MESESSTSSLLEALYTTSTKRTFRVTAYTKTELGSNPCQKEGRLARTAQYKHHASPHDKNEVTLERRFTGPAHLRTPREVALIQAQSPELEVASTHTHSPHRHVAGDLRVGRLAPHLIPAQCVSISFFKVLFTITLRKSKAPRMGTLAAR